MMNLLKLLFLKFGKECYAKCYCSDVPQKDAKRKKN